MSEIVNAESRVPKYLQIEGWIEEMVAKGRFRIGDKLPSEIKLAELCGVNRNTIRQAISELVSRGLLATRNGVGTFVSSRIPQTAKYSLDHISSSARDISRAGFKPRTKLVLRHVIEVTGTLSDKLMLGTSSQVIQIVRLRMGDQTPFILERSHVPYAEFKNLLNMDLSGSLYQLLVDRFRVTLARSVQNFRAVLLTGPEARLLRVEEGSPGIFLESTIYDAKGVAVEVLHSHFRGDKYVFQVHSGDYQVSLEGEKHI